MGIEHWELSIGQIVCFLIGDRICEKLYLDNRDLAANCANNANRPLGGIRAIRG